MFPLQFKPEIQFWEAVFLNAMGAISEPEGCAKYADEAVEEWQKRWKADSQIPAELLRPAPPTVDTLVKAQDELEAARKQLDAIKTLCLKMPEDLGEAYFNVDGVRIEERVKQAEAWVKEVQQQMEKQG